MAYMVNYSIYLADLYFEFDMPALDKTKKVGSP